MLKMHQTLHIQQFKSSKFLRPHQTLHIQQFKSSKFLRPHLLGKIRTKPKKFLRPLILSAIIIGTMSKLGHTSSGNKIKPTNTLGLYTSNMELIIPFQIGSFNGGTTLDQSIKFFPSKSKKDFKFSIKGSTKTLTIFQ